MSSQLSFHALFSDHAVLQRDARVPVYGRARPGTRVDVTLDDERCQAIADDTGRWSVTFGPRPAGNAHRIVAASDGERIEASDVAFGDVWLASGQSNMQFSLADSLGAAEEIATAADFDLRVFTLPQVQSDTPTDACTAAWKPTTRASAGGFSAVAYYFGKAMRHLDVPIGMIVSAWGGTRIASWIPGSRLDQKDAIPPPPADSPFELSLELHADPGNVGFGAGFASPDFDDSSWESLRAPSYWQEHGHYCNGAAWYRLRVEVPDAWIGRDAWLDLGAVDDFDQTYFNGVSIGGIGPENPSAYAVPRHYRIDGALLEKTNTVAVRVFDHWGSGGIVGPASSMRLYVSDPQHGVPLDGKWRFKFEHVLRWRIADATALGSSTLYNAMIHPLARSPIRGFLWYQGESDSVRAERYRALLKTLIESWREAFGDSALPFGVVQLPAYKPRENAPGDDDWAELREAQLGALELPNTGVVVTLDLGDAVDIHPRRKREVGERLARWALGAVHGQPVAHRGPVALEHRVDGSGIVVCFAHAEGLRARGGGDVSGFEIAAADRRFVRARARIDGDSVRVSHPEVTAPVAVRYAWAANPDANLENGAGLLASPFRTDRWPGVTAGQT